METKMLLFLLLSSARIHTTVSSFAGVLGGRLKISPDVRITGQTIEEIADNAITGHTIFIYNVLLNEKDLDHLVEIVQRKTASLSIYNQREWDRFFWSPIIENGHHYKKITNLVVYGIKDFMYMRQLLCKARVFIVAICFDSLDAILRSSKII
ncbi:uncharacterized protein [Macrobrachium rosenbergii]|uniref:uncharacterized protein n=1 Tax=Macrobrachium rosenbergii TaxID=79674 RepID=UPI0034D78CFA